MKMLDHPNIVKLFETFEDAKNIYLVLELCRPPSPRNSLPSPRLVVENHPFFPSQERIFFLGEFVNLGFHAN